MDLLRVTTPREIMRQRLGIENAYTVLYIGAHGIARTTLTRFCDAAALLKDRADIVFSAHGRGHEKKELQDRRTEKDLKQGRLLDPHAERKNCRHD